jgi:hypothetical protein
MKKIEMGNIPDQFHPSAIASMLATKKLRAWVLAPTGTNKRPPFRFDLRPGREASECSLERALLDTAESVA